MLVYFREVVVIEERDEMILKYLKLSFSIDGTKKRIRRLKEEYYSKNLYTRNEPDYGSGRIIVRAYRVETEIVKYVDVLMDLEKSIATKSKKLRYFNCYLEELPLNEREYLYNRFLRQFDVIVQEQVEQAAYEEILEIEDAISYMNGEIPDKLSQVEDSTELKFDELLEVLDL